MTLFDLLTVTPPAQGFIVQVYLGGTTPDDPMRSHQVYIDKHFRMTGTLTGMLAEYFDGSAWQPAFSLP